MKFSISSLPVLTLAWTLLLAASPGFAALGGSQSTLTLEQEGFGAPFSSAPSGGFTLFSLTNPDGVSVRQYVSAAGRVFAVAWNGPVLPDFELLLGSHFAAYERAQRQKGRGVRVLQPDLVIESSGMMRAFVGRAYLATQLPAGVKPSDIQ
ncbi:MAG: DUF2844 domain-containing protein [Rhodoferax sp.]|nr:DUF2844 domain-containing protein [Rhodoferax sp.]MCF8212016.1 DUF2844 domain-containing protein [Rhodoferax sp.]